MSKLKMIADSADMIINGYAFIKDGDNVRVVNGSLRITARKEDYHDASYTSGRIDTKNKQTFKYGYF